MTDGTKMSALYLSPGNRLITVFGGGKVALRKCLHFDGFRIKVIADKILPEIVELAETVIEERIDLDQCEEYMKGSAIVIAATDNKEINAKVRDTAMSLGIPANSAHGGGDILIPSILKKKNYSICVSSEGKVPAFPPYLINELDNFLDEKYDSMMELLIELRKIIRTAIPKQEDRAKFLADVLADKEIWAMLENGDMESALKTAKSKGDL